MHLELKELFLKKNIRIIFKPDIFGEGSYGIASASLQYFDKPINELNYSEAALLLLFQKHRADIILIKILN